jgi:hypothetical protein
MSVYKICGIEIVFAFRTRLAMFCVSWLPQSIILITVPPEKDSIQLKIKKMLEKI